MLVKNVRPPVNQSKVHAIFAGRGYVAGRVCKAVVVMVLVEFIGLILVSPRNISLVKILELKLLSILEA